MYCQIDDSPASAIGGGDEDEYGEMRELRVFIQDDKCMSSFLHPSNHGRRPGMDDTKIRMDIGKLRKLGLTSSIAPL